MAKDGTLEDRHTVRTSKLQTVQLEELRVKKNLSSMSDIIRYCIERTLEDESDAVGSRLHFSRTMGKKIDELTEEMRVANAIQLLAITDGLTDLTNLLEEDADADPLDAEDVRMGLYKTAVKSDLLKVVAAQQSIYRQQRKELRKKKAPVKQKPQTSDS